METYPTCNFYTYSNSTLFKNPICIRGRYFGYNCSSSIDGTVIAIGCYGDNTAGLYSGAIYVFKWNSGTSQYDQAQKLIPSDGSAYEFLGRTCPMTGDGSVIISGAYGDDAKGSFSGSTRVFELDSGTSHYDQVQKLLASDGVANDYFGSSCSVSGDASIVVVGAHSDDDNGSNSGSVYIFT